MKRALLCVSIFIVGVLCGAYPMYMIGEKLNLNNSFQTAAQNAYNYRLLKTNKTAELEASLSNRLNNSIIKLERITKEVTWVDCSQASLHDELLLLQYVKETHGKELKRFCPNTLEEYNKEHGIEK